MLDNGSGARVMAHRPREPAGVPPVTRLLPRCLLHGTSGLVEKFPWAQGKFSFWDPIVGIISGEHVNYSNTRNDLDCRTATGLMTQLLQ